MLDPDFDLNSHEAGKELSEQADNVVQNLYKEARDSIEDQFGVEIHLPTKHNIVFEIEEADAAIDLQYQETGAERFTLKNRERGKQKVSVEEFREELSDEYLFRFKKAIALYKAIADVQSKEVDHEVLEARYV